MNRSNLRTFLYTALICLIIFGVISLAIRALPYLILTGIVIWIVMKVYGFFRTNKSSVSSKNNNQAPISKAENNKDGVDTSKAIDVDFEEVD